ncbi:MAG: DUF1800 domain-containing protein [Pseudomonadota bacterium]
MPPHCSRPARLRLLPTLATLTLAISGILAAHTVLAQTGTSTAAAWRATSRLGYGPTADSAQAAETNPRAWALQQIDAAYAASKSAPYIPADINRFNQPLGDIARDYRAEREARRTVREQAAATQAGTPPAPNTKLVDNATDALGFSREMQQTAAAWRLLSCSDPSIENPLLAKMTEFWFNHLNVFVGKGNVRPFTGHYVVNAIRANALGRFEDLLLASARHPAMLYYLDQAQSNVRGLNENYARELMELHTLGVDAGYTQNDVHELARILTGWTVGLQQGEGFRFAERLHDNGDKTLLKTTFQSNGVREGEEAIRMLARQPATANRIARRLAMTFVADKPSQALVNQLSSTFVNTQGDIRAVMRTLVNSPEFWRADNKLFKTPLDFACSALTAGGGVKDRRELQLTLGFLAQAGQPMHGWQTPDGYKTNAATWLAPEALTRRADYAIALGARMAEPLYLQPFMSSSSRERIAQEPASQRTGLTLASPDFMSK